MTSASVDLSRLFTWNPRRAPAAAREGRDRTLRIERLGRAPFREGLEHMLAAQKARRRGGGDILFLMEPSAVVTLGSRTAGDPLLLPPECFLERGIEVLQVDRGGEATYHGPGQLLGYPVVYLAPDERDLHLLLRGIEQALIEALRGLGVDARAQTGRTGVWVEERKIASIGLSCRGWVTGHGFALNLGGDLSPFSLIVPCGMRGCSPTSVEAETGARPPRAVVEEIVAERLAHHLGRRRLR